jgi:flagellin
MSLGVLNNINAVYAENNLNNTNNSLSTVLQQLSSGSKINSGADDAAGLSLVNGLEANQQALTQSKTNATEGVGLLQVADGALSQVTSLLNRAVTLATEASNGTLNSTQDLAANQEYQSILSEVNNIGTTTTYNQQQVFNSQTNIYTGDSSSQGSSIDALNIRTLSSANLGDSQGVMSYSNGANNVFINLSNGGTNAAVTDSLNASGATTIQVSYMTKGAAGAAVAATANISVGSGTAYQNTAEGLITAINNAGLGLNATFTTAQNAGSAAVATALASDNGSGSASNTGIEISASGIAANTAGTIGTGVVGSLSLTSGDTLGGTLSIVGSDGTSHNITLGTADSTDTLGNLESTINSAGYGVTASLNQAGNELTFTSDSANVSVSGTNLTQNTASTNQNIVVENSTLGSITVGSATDALTGALNISDILNGVTTANPITLGTTGTTDNLADLAKTINADAAYGITATLNAASSTPGAPAAGTVLTFTKTEGYGGIASITDTTLTDVASPTIAQGDTLGSLAVSSGSDTLGAGTLDIISGTSGKAATITTGTAGSTDTLANLANTINAGGYGITATMNNNGTALTFTQSSGTYAASIASSPGQIVDNTFPTTDATFAAGTAFETITLAGATDTLGDSSGLAKNFVLTTGAGVDTINMGAGGMTLSALATAINGLQAGGDAMATATVNQAGTVLTIMDDSGANGLNVATPWTLTSIADSNGGGHFQDNVKAVDNTSAITSSIGTLGTLSTLTSGNTLTGNLDIVSGTSTAGGAIAIGTAAGVGQTLAQIANDFDYSGASYATGTVQGVDTGTQLNNLGIYATLNAAGTQLTFTQETGTANNVHVASIATAPTSGNLAQTDVVATGDTLGSLTAATVNDTLSGNFTVTSGATAGATPTTLNFSGQTLAQIAADFNTKTGTDNWSGYGITATLNAAGSGEPTGTVLTFTQSSGDAGTAAITNNGYITDVTAPVTTNPNISVSGSNTLTAAASGDTLTGTLEVTSSADVTTAYSFTGQTLTQIAASFNNPGATNNGLGITAAVVNNVLTFTPGGGSAVSGVGITDYTPAASANATVATGTILNTITAANSTDLFSGDLTITDGSVNNTGTNNVVITAGQTLQNIADDFNDVSSDAGAVDTATLDDQGITASLANNGTELILTQTLGDPHTANVVSDAATPLVDQVSAAAVKNAATDGALAVDSANANTLVVGGAGDTLTGTLGITEGVDTNKTTTTFNLNGTTLAHLADDFNGVNYGTGYTDLSNTGIQAVINAGNSNLSVSFVANGGEAGAAYANVTALTAIVDQSAAVTTNISTNAGTMLDTLTVNSKNDTLGGTLNLTSGITGAAIPAITLGTKGTTDTLADLATTINGAGYGITATLNTAGTELTLSQNSGDGFAAKATGTSVTDSESTGIVAGTGLGTLAVNTTNDTLTGTLTGTEGDGKTAYTINLNGQTLAGLAAQIDNADAAYGIVATLNTTAETLNGTSQAAGTVLTFTANPTDTGTPTLSNQGNIADVTPVGITDINLANIPTTTGAASSTQLGTLSNVLSTATLSGSLTIGSNTIDIGPTNNSASTLVTAIDKGDYGVTAAYNASTNTLSFTSPNSSLTVNTGNLDETAINGSTAAPVGALQGPAVTTSGYYSVGVSGTVADTSTLGGTANVGITTNANGSGGIATIGYSDGAGESLASTDLTNAGDAQAALNDLNAAISDVAAQDGYIGAQINTLNSVSQVLSTQQENVQSAQNAVQATDYASATSNMSKYEILSQTGISALAQANSMQQEVTKLLQ